jgi:glycine cleavage system H lipoate-binding protein
MNENNSIPSKNIWPESEIPCIWMEAGIIDFKLCDRNLDCETCSFDASIRGGKALPFHSTNDAKAIGRSFARPENKKDLQKIPPQKDILSPFYHIGYDPDSYYCSPCLSLQFSTDHTALVSIYILGSLLLPYIKDVIISKPESVVKRNEAFAWIVTHTGTICLRMPIQGKITQVNHQATSQLNSRQQKTDTWLVRMAVDEGEKQSKELVRGIKAKKYLKSQHLAAVRLLRAALNDCSAETGATLQDGGVRIENIENILGTGRYFSIVRIFFENKTSHL